jgi:GWxTD domain-containing protein
MGHGRGARTGVRGASGGAGWPLAFLGAGLWRSGDGAAAEAAFDAALAAMDPADRDILEDVSRSITLEHERNFLSGDHKSRVAWSRFLMRTADPLFLTPLNERKLEHFTRVALAELLFGEPVNGLHGSRSAQGEILVRYGEPDVVRRVLPQHGSGRGRPLVTWGYTDERISFIFDHRVGRRAGYFVGNSARNADLLREVQPSTYDFRTEPMRHQIARFQGSRPELVEVDVHALLPAGPRDARLPGRAGFFLLPRALHEDLTRLESPVRIGGDEPAMVTFRVRMEPSSFTYTVEAMTDDESVRARTRSTLHAATFLDSLPALSDILLADRITPRSDVQIRERHDLVIAPSADLCFERDGSVWLYFEVYGLVPDPGGAGRYRVVLDVADSGGRSVLARATDWFAGILGRRREAAGQLTWERTVPSVTPRTPEWFEVRLDNVRNGVHRIMVTITDLVSGGTAGAQRSFAVGSLADCEILPGTP